MSDKNHLRVVLITRKSRLQELIERFNTWAQAKFYLEHNHVDVQDYLNEHDVYQQRLQQAEHILKPIGRFQQLERSLLASYQFSERDIVVVLGQDGLVANTLKYLDGQPVIAVNPDPTRWDGKLLPFNIGDLQQTMEQTLNACVAYKSVTFAEAVTNYKQRLVAVNDLFIGPKTHTSARYRLSWRGASEEQSSSGIIVSTGLGSTGWFQSILAGAMAVSSQKAHPLQGGFAWDEQRLQFSVREPFPSQLTGVRLAFGEITPDTCLTLESHMPENGFIFSDGIEADYLPFISGTTVKVRIATTRGRLVIPAVT